MAAPETKLGLLHERLADRFLKALDDPECPAAVLNVIAKFLKDNSIECDPNDDKMKALASKASALEFPFDPAQTH